MTPQLLGDFMSRCFQEGALDVTLCPVLMKKNRPGVMVSVLCDEARRAALLDLFGTDTTTLGVRVLPARRVSLPRAIETVDTPYGAVAVKVASLPNGGRKIHPEYESARAAAEATDTPVAEVMRTAAEIAHRRFSG
jgi:uncharacterized protein (DUF111 family)